MISAKQARLITDDSQFQKDRRTLMDSIQEKIIQFANEGKYTTGLLATKVNNKYGTSLILSIVEELKCLEYTIDCDMNNCKQNFGFSWVDNFDTINMIISWTEFNKFKRF